MSYLKRIVIQYWPASVVSLATFIIYLASLRNEFVAWDDNFYIYDNPAIRTLGEPFFRWAFLNFYYSNWHPLTWVSHALDYAIWGLNPMGHHLTSIVLHAVNTFLVVLLAVRLLEASRKFTPDKISPNPSLSKRGTSVPLHSNPARPPLKVRGGEGGVIPGGDRGELSDKETLIAASITGLLFGIHPLHVESVAWVSERKDLLCAFFFLLSIMAYVRYSLSFPVAGNPSLDTPVKPGYDRNKRVIPQPSIGAGGRHDRGIQFLNGYYLASLVLFILALMSKPMAVSLPVVLLILDWYPLGRIVSLKTAWKASIEKMPFIVLSLASAVLTILAQRAGGALKPIEFAPLPVRLLVSCKSLVAYLVKVLLPLDLSPFYPYPKEASILSPEYVGSILILIGITVACILATRRQKLPLAVWCYYLITLLPVLGIVQVGGQAMADRYLYLPGIGAFLVIGLAVAWGLKKALTSKAAIKLVYVGILILAVLSLFILTFRQIGAWRNSITLFSFIIEKSPGQVPFAHYNRGMIYEGMGMLDRAVADYNEAISLNPRYSEAYNSRGIVFNKLGRFGEAMADFGNAITSDPGNAKGYINRGFLYLKARQIGPAIIDFRQACALGEGFGCAMVQYAEKMR